MKYYKSNGAYVDDKVVAEIRADAIDLFDRHLWNYSHEVWENFKPILEKLKE